MKQETRYHYEQRIRELLGRATKAENNLHLYREVAQSIFDSILEFMNDGKVLSQAWILKQFKRVMR